MNNKELAKKIVDIVNEETSNYDAIEKVEEFLNTIIKIKESVESESNTSGVWIAYAAGTMDYKKIRISYTERGAYIKLAECWGLDYESELIDYLNNYEGETEKDFQSSLCEECEGKVEYVSLK